MAGHRFEIGEGVVHVEKRFPTGTRRAELTVVERMLGAEGPEYRLHDADRLATCVLAEDQLSPRASADTEGSRRLRASAPAPSGDITIRPTGQS